VEVLETGSVRVRAGEGTIVILGFPADASITTSSVASMVNNAPITQAMTRATVNHLYFGFMLPFLLPLSLQLLMSIFSLALPAKS
jgi:hypothetical protein